MKNTIAFICAFIFCALVIWGAYWVGKHGSYFFFYEDMVKQTITEMVKKEAMR